jgi:hypothetical protein
VHGYSPYGLLVFASVEGPRDEGDGIGVFRCAGVGVVVGADAAAVVDGLQGEQSMPPVQWNVGRCGWPGWDRRERDFVRENELLGRVSAQESVGALLSGDDFGAGGDVEVG